VGAFVKATKMTGPQLRDALWVQGCSLRCPGCANQAFLPHVKARHIPVSLLLKHFSTRLGKIDGISVLGGEPTEQVESVTELLIGVKALGLSVIVFTGRLLCELENDVKYKRMLAHTDLLVDGPFIAGQVDLTLPWMGSSNQKLHRLTDYFKADDFDFTEPNGEIIIKKDRIVFNGIGSRLLIKEKKISGG
jgi:anaerobic ribonucleoside-triphosphate reductase activating protein